MDPDNDPNPRVKLKPDYITVKNSLKAILKKAETVKKIETQQDHIDIINDAVHRTNIIVQQMLMFFKLYMIKWIDDMEGFHFKPIGDDKK
jgi:hypothetical protein